jgi:hypothetical protein
VVSIDRSPSTTRCLVATAAHPLGVGEVPGNVLVLFAEAAGRVGDDRVGAQAACQVVGPQRVPDLLPRQESRLQQHAVVEELAELGYFVLRDDGNVHIGPDRQFGIIRQTHRRSGEVRAPAGVLAHPVDRCRLVCAR